MCWTIINLSEKIILALLVKTKLGNGLTVWRISWQQNFLRREDARSYLQSARERGVKWGRISLKEDLQPGSLAMEPEDILSPDRGTLVRLGLADIKARVIKLARSGADKVEIVDSETDMIISSFGPIGIVHMHSLGRLLRSWGVPVEGMSIADQYEATNTKI